MIETIYYNFLWWLAVLFSWVPIWVMIEIFVKRKKISPEGKWSAYIFSVFIGLHVIYFLDKYYPF